MLKVTLRIINEAKLSFSTLISDKNRIYSTFKKNSHSRNFRKVYFKEENVTSKERTKKQGMKNKESD